MFEKNLQNLDDGELIKKALKGDEGAFVALYRKYVAQLYGFVYSKVNSKTDAEDLTSETFYHVLRNLSQYSGKSSFKNWVYGIAKHLILAHYREKYNKPLLELNENVAIPIPYEEVDTDEQKKTAEKLQKILVQLPENYRRILELRFLKGYSIVETAKELGITVANAKVLQHRALKKATELIKDENEDLILPEL